MLSYIRALLPKIILTIKKIMLKLTRVPLCINFRIKTNIHKEYA